eukprot:TRINITY_DN20139_c0_g1_i1.p1 TRINITY_DN20139_c0_g1~~TRINITY_DN20139_c0_g1_i1.p1  ORF type:complete len:685 (-),score=88.49 TRINITY_DN20139_c0_g1_i1:25-2079(-)
MARVSTVSSLPPLAVGGQSVDVSAAKPPRRTLARGSSRSRHAEERADSPQRKPLLHRRGAHSVDPGRRVTSGVSSSSAARRSSSSHAARPPSREPRRQQVSFDPPSAGYSPNHTSVEQSQRDTYRYVVQYGNNSPVIRQLMRQRQRWMPAPGDPGSSSGNTSYQDKQVKLKPSSAGPEINFLWTQYKAALFLNAMADSTPGLVVVLNEEKTIKLKQLTSKAHRTEDLPASMPVPLRAHNHFENSALLTTKAGIRESMVKLYLPLGRDPFGAVPLTFIVREGTADPQFALWRQAFDGFESEADHKIWLVKPGDRGNRGCGIKIYNTVEEIAARADSKQRVWAIQKYMERPFLIHKRKFDIRAYCLVLQEPAAGTLKAFCFRDAYLRTTSVQYTTKTFDKMVHLNNDAVQKNGEDYGKFESANKMSFEEFQRYLDEHHSKDKVNVRKRIVPQIQGLMADAIRAAGARGLNPRGIPNCFEIFGFDFMIDASYRVWLIECNANPCLDLCSAYLSRVIPTMLDQALMLTLDRMFPSGAPTTAMDFGGEAGTKWDLIFDSSQETTPPTISCSWVETLPQGVDVASCAPLLGRQIVCAKLKSKQRTSKKASQLENDDRDAEQSPAARLDSDRSQQSLNCDADAGRLRSRSGSPDVVSPAAKNTVSEANTAVSCAAPAPENDSEDEDETFPE